MRVRLTLAFAGIVLLAGVVLLGALWVSLRFFFRPDGLIITTVHSFADGVVLSFVPTAAVVLAALLLVGLVGGWILAGRLLAPLTRLTDATRLAATGSLSHRIRLPGRHDEFRELADAFDTMLARLEAHVAAQRRFAANASHELRTPLAITQTLLDVARNDPDHDHGLLIDRLSSVNARAVELTEALLLLSRADQRSFTPETVDLSLSAEEAVETLVPLAEKHRVTLETAVVRAPALGSPALLLQLATNLVHNAIVHNLPAGGTVRIGTAARPGGAVLTVENTGPLLPPELVATLTEPFRRGVERVRAGHDGAGHDGAGHDGAGHDGAGHDGAGHDGAGHDGAGHDGAGHHGVGLGLAIVASITDAHDGTLALDPLAAGGLRVTVGLPAG